MLPVPTILAHMSAHANLVILEMELIVMVSILIDWLSVIQREPRPHMIHGLKGLRNLNSTPNIFSNAKFKLCNKIWKNINFSLTLLSHFKKQDFRIEKCMKNVNQITKSCNKTYIFMNRFYKNCLEFIFYVSNIISHSFSYDLSFGIWILAN